MLCTWYHFLSYNYLFFISSTNNVFYLTTLIRSSSMFVANNFVTIVLSYANHLVTIMFSWIVQSKRFLLNVILPSQLPAYCFFLGQIKNLLLILTSSVFELQIKKECLWCVYNIKDWQRKKKKKLILFQWFFHSFPFPSFLFSSYLACSYQSP